MKRQPKPDLRRIGVVAKQRARSLAEHSIADSDFANTIFAVYGVASPLGRIVDRRPYSCAAIRLNHDFPWLGEERGLCTYAAPDGPVTPSAAATEMKVHALRRMRGRKTPSTPEAHRAMYAYAGSCSTTSRPCSRKPPKGQSPKQCDDGSARSEKNARPSSA